MYFNCCLGQMFVSPTSTSPIFYSSAKSNRTFYLPGRKYYTVQWACLQCYITRRKMWSSKQNERRPCYLRQVSHTHTHIAALLWKYFLSLFWQIFWETFDSFRNSLILFNLCYTQHTKLGFKLGLLRSNIYQRFCGFMTLKRHWVGKGEKKLLPAKQKLVHKMVFMVFKLQKLFNHWKRKENATGQHFVDWKKILHYRTTFSQWPFFVVAPTTVALDPAFLFFWYLVFCFFLHLLGGGGKTHLAAKKIGVSLQVNYVICFWLLQYSRV